MDIDNDFAFCHYDFTAEGEKEMDDAMEWLETADLSFLFDHVPSDETRIYMIPPIKIMVFYELHNALYKLARTFGGKLNIRIDYKIHSCSFELEVVMIDCDYREPYFLNAMVLSSKMEALVTNNGLIRFCFDLDLFRRIG